MAPWMLCCLAGVNAIMRLLRNRAWAEVQLAEGYGWVESGQIETGGGLCYFGGTEENTEEYAQLGCFEGGI